MSMTYTVGKHLRDARFISVIIFAIRLVPAIIISNETMGHIRVKTNTLRNSLLLLSSGLMLVLGNTTAFAATKSAASPTVNTQQLKISPVRTDLTIAPGTTGTVKVIVTNLTVAITVEPIENDFVAGGEEGQPALILSPDSYAPSHSLKRFMLPLQNVTIPPLSGVSVPVQIVVPKTAQAGGYFGAIRFEPTSGGSSNTNSVALSESVASLILMTVPGPTFEQLSLTNFNVQQNGSSSSNFRTPNDLSLYLRFENLGNLQEAPFGQIYVQHGKKVVYTYNFNQTQPQNEILPDSYRLWTIPLKGMGKFGKYTVGATLTYGTKGTSIDITKTIWIIPTTYIIAGVIILVALIVLIGGGVIFPKSYKRKILQASRRRY